MVTPAFAQKHDLTVAERVALENSARKACIVGDYAKGVDILADLFISARNPVYIYNQGRCFQQNHQWQAAIDRFKEYLRNAKNLSDSEIAQVNAYIAECEEPLRAEAVVSDDPPPAPLVSDPAPVPPAQTTEDPGSGLRTAGVVLGAIGLAGTISGIYCSVKSYQVRDHADQLSNYKTAGYVSYGVGAAGLASGIALYLIGHSKRRAKPPALSWFPHVAPERAALFVRGNF